MRPLRAPLVLALLVSFAAPGMVAVALELHVAIDHHGGHHAGGEGHHGEHRDEGTDLGPIAFHGHHHPSGDPDHGHPALRTRMHRTCDGRSTPGSTVAPPAVASPASATGSATPGRSPDGRAGPDEPSRRSASGNGPPDTLLSGFCSLLL